MRWKTKLENELQEELLQQQSIKLIMLKVLLFDFIFVVIKKMYICINFNGVEIKIHNAMLSSSIHL